MITVLFVDDEPALLDLSRIFLERTGEVKVDTCGNAIEGLRQTRQKTLRCDHIRL